MRRQRTFTCSYAVGIGPADVLELKELAAYLSSLAVHGCEVLVFDDSPRQRFEENHRVLRWVAKHLPAGDDVRSPNGTLDLMRAALLGAGCEKVIIARPDMRWPPRAIGEACELLERHEAVEPRDYLDPLPWWGAIDAGRILLERGIDPDLDRSGSVAFRRSAVRPLRALIVPDGPEGTARRLAGLGAEVFTPATLSVGRRPGALREWLARRPAAAAEEFATPMRSTLFLSLIPLLLFFAVAGGAAAAATCASAIVSVSLGLALRGRLVAGRSFPLRACLFAPLAVFERALSVYWALSIRLAGSEREERTAAAADRAREAPRAHSR